ncbi:MAG: hypothetical protein WCD31_13055, partial [Gillisia sp.]
SQRMLVKKLPYCRLSFFKNFVIVEPHENVVMDSAKVKSALSVMIRHFGGNEFSIISYRRNKYTVADDAYNPFTARLFKRVKGFAVVSDCASVREKAIEEQEKFNGSFAFFERLEEAQNWAINMVSMPNETSSFL